MGGNMTSSISYGWTGRRLSIDLSGRSTSAEQIDSRILSQFLGGRGLNAVTLTTRLEADVDPLGPDNILCFGAGLLTGTTVPSSGRYNVSAKSPATGLFGDANSGGFWAPELKYAGYDQLLVTGRAAEPVYVLIKDGCTEIRSATHLWGKSVWDTERLIKEELKDDSLQISSIGQAGENRVRYAAVINNLSRAAGRTGMGAVMGSKNLKAIAVKGTQGLNIADRHGLRRLNRKLLSIMYESPSFPLRSTLGTSLLIELYNGMGVLPTRNARESTFEGSASISGRLLMDRYVIKPKSCFGCPVHCSHYYVVKEGPYAGTAGEGPEFETLCALGSRCGNGNLESILAANNLCNQYGLDTISTGGVIAFAMECYEKGLLTKTDVDGLELVWGNHEAIISLIHKIASREGVGDLLAEGVARMSQQIPGSEGFALHVKGLETPEQDVRGLKSWGLGWAVSSRGADHCRAFPLAETTWKPEEAERLFGTKNAADRFSYDGKPEMVKWYEEYSAVGDALEFCRIAQLGLNMPLDLIAEIVNAVTGLQYSAADLLQVGERIVQVERMFNLRNGLKPDDDRLPARFLNEAISAGPSKGHRYDQKRVLEKYYRLRDWDAETGWPGAKTLQRLDVTLNRLGLE
jgi:aldehyde:ferredoxin oxidoreductase